MVPDGRADNADLDCAYFFHEDNRVGGNAGVRGIDGETPDLLSVFAVPDGRDAVPLECGLRHRDRRGELVVGVACRDLNDPRPGLDRAGLFHVAGVVGVLREAPDTVPAHRGLALIGLEEPHPDLGRLRCLEEENASAPMPNLRSQKSAANAPFISSGMTSPLCSSIRIKSLPFPCSLVNAISMM